MPEADLRSTAAYRYELPEDRIAKAPAEPADASRLLAVARDGTLAHRTFLEFPALLRAGDVLVINRTRVIKARLRGRREPGGGAAEILVLRPADRERYDDGALRWRALVRPGRKLGVGARVRFGDDTLATIVAAGEGGEREIAFESSLAFGAILEKYGAVPLPPYVGSGDAARDARYQTIFASTPGSVAAPTASLHFTPRVVEAILAAGVTIVPLVLDVGLGTFKPMEGATIDAHRMHEETYEIPRDTARTIESAKREGRRIVVAGTTALRALESAARDDGTLAFGAASTKLFITPGFRFRMADALLTNFHLPESTLLVLVAAFAGYDATMRAYATAIQAGYRFFSFGDAMFVERAVR